jgi:hypothetical protein
LQETQVGKTISSLKSISDESVEAKDVKQLSDGLVEHWKKLLKMEKQGAVKVAGNGKGAAEESKMLPPPSLTK